MAKAPPLFSVIVVDFDGTVPRPVFRRKMRALAAQTSKDFEVLVWHDGPKQRPYAEDMAGIDLGVPVQFFVTEARENKWGHPNRDRGIRAAQGDWITHSNADNVFYPDLIATLAKAARDETPVVDVAATVGPDVATDLIPKAWRKAKAEGRVVRRRPDILIYPVLMRGWVPAWPKNLQFDQDDPPPGLVLPGLPVIAGNIDAMQLVMRRATWLAEGGWHDHSKNSDGALYERFAKKYAVRIVPQVLGEHF